MPKLAHEFLIDRSLQLRRSRQLPEPRQSLTARVAPPKQDLAVAFDIEERIGYFAALGLPKLHRVLLLFACLKRHALLRQRTPHAVRRFWQADGCAQFHDR